MGCWGMAITQSDEYQEVYDSFMEKYNEGMEVPEITKGILARYHEEFDDEDGVLHDVYFALAKAEWMCGCLSENILLRVEEIIETDANIEFMRELEADEADLRARRKNLDKFLTSLKTPRSTPKKRVPPPKPRVIQYAIMEKGEVFSYKSKGDIYGGLILEKLKTGLYLVALSEALPSAPKRAEEVLCAPVFTAAWANELLAESRVKRLGKVEVEGHYNARAGIYYGDNVFYNGRNVNNIFCVIGEIGGFIRPQVWAHEMDKGRYPGLKMWDMLREENVPAVDIPPHYQSEEYRKHILGKK